MSKTEETRAVQRWLAMDDARMERWLERAAELTEFKDPDATEEDLEPKVYRLADEIRSDVVDRVEATDGIGLELLTLALRRVDWARVAERYIGVAMRKRREGEADA